MRKLAFATGFIASALLAACGGGGGDVFQPQGTVKLSLTDAPACYKEVWVSVEKVRIHKSGDQGENGSGWEEIVPPDAPVRVNLLDLTNGDLEDLGSAQVDTGTYRHMRLVLSDAANANQVVLLDNSRHDLKTPSGQSSGIKLRTDFDVRQGRTTDLVLDFDACKSVVKAGNSGQYILKPVIRLSDKVPGGIQGYVATAMVSGAATTAVTAYRGDEAVRATVPDSDGKFKLAYLQPGTYTVVITSSDRAAGVITEVPVERSVLTVAGSGSRITLPASTMHTVSGTVRDGSSAVGDAFVTAWQEIRSGFVNVLSTAVDYDTGEYTLKLPTDDPVVAPYDASGLSFGDDATAGGEYTLQATAPDRRALAQDVDSRNGSSTDDVDFAY